MNLPSGSTSTSSTTTSSVTTETTSSTASSSTESTSSATSSTAEATSSSSVLTGRSGSREVDSDGSASQLLALERLKGGLGLVGVRELDVTEALGGTGLSVSRQSHALHVSVVTESLVDLVLAERVRQSTDVQGVAGRRERVAVGLGSLLGGRGGSSGLRVVDSDVSAVNLRLVLLDGLGGALEVGEGDETESSRSLSLGVGHDLGRGDLTTRLELGSQPVVVDVPRELTNEDSQSRLVLAVVLDLGLLGRGLGGIVGLSLA